MVVPHVMARGVSTRTFGDWAQTIFKKIIQFPGDVHVVFERYVTPSLKDLELEALGNSGNSTTLTYQITGSSQKAPRDMAKALLQQSFKKPFTVFLTEELKKYTTAQSNKFFFTQEKTCYCIVGALGLKEIEELNCNYKEADTRLLVHAKQATLQKKEQKLSLKNKRY